MRFDYHIELITPAFQRRLLYYIDGNFVIMDYADEGGEYSFIITLGNMHFTTKKMKNDSLT